MSTAAAAKQKVHRKDFVISLPENMAECVITPLRKFTDDEFWQFCSSNRELRIEMTSEGQMMIMMPVGGEGSSRNFNLTGRFSAWVENNDSGIGFDSSGGFKLPNKAKRSPGLTRKKRKFTFIVPAIQSKCSTTPKRFPASLC